MERTGHRSIEGIRSYKRTSGEQQEAVSDILSNCKKTCTDLQPLHSALIPANLHIVDTVVDSLFHPIGTQENQQSSFGIFIGVR